MEIPVFAAWQIAFCSAWTVRMQWVVLCPSSWVMVLSWWPTSSQCGSPEGDPAYPVDSICLSFTMMQLVRPLLQVDR